MKKIYNILAACVIGLTLTSCDDFLDYNPTAVIDVDKAFADPEGMVTSAYAMLGDCWYSYPFNLFPYGDIASDDCLKGGSGPNDTGYHAIDIWKTVTPTTPGEMDELWYRLYCAVSRCNRALLSLEGHFYYKLLTVFRKIPWIDEKVEAAGSQESVKNDAYKYRELFGKVIDDFKAAYDVLPVKGPGEDGRANKIAAAAYLAKCYLNLAWGDGYEANTGVGHITPEYMDSVVYYTNDVVNSDYGYLEDYGDIFLPEYKNSKESIFAVQCSDYEDDHTTFGRANWSTVLNGCWQIWSCGWDFHKPSQNLVNAFKTKNGLPMFDDYNNSIDYPINGQPTAQKWDPRLFHTVGMPSFPYKYEAEYTQTMANSRDATDYGYYTSLKEVPQRSKGETYNDSWQAFAMNEYVLRYTDVMLMRAEALIELGRLSEARTIINDIRRRAANSVAKHIDYAANQCEIAEYPESYFANKETARKCLRWERRLEMAMENGRFFDLRRWGIASQTLNAYYASEQNDVYSFFDHNGNVMAGAPVTYDSNGNITSDTEMHYGQYYRDGLFTAGKNEFFPIPYNQMFYIPGLYTQNEGYN